MNVFHYKQFDIQQDHAAMKVGTDCDLLGAMTPCPVTTSQVSSPNILDIGTGTGVLALMMAQRFPTAHITAVEIDDNAIIDAQANFAASPFSDRISLHHTSFQDFLTAASPAGYSCIICNPPYFDKSMECPDLGRSRARHSSSLPFDILAQGAYELLADGGFFTVCIPPEVLETFQKECLFAGFTTKEM
ncbi:MAG: methyltransferase, partial [Prevotella sp.]|nr:methyltransferase [Candidatus Prevotella equi]